MKKSLIIAALILAAGWSHAQQSTKQILFVGNSLTYFYGMPTTFGEMANYAGEKVLVTQHTEGNTGFIHHVASDKLYATIRSRTWDYVILQPGSYETYGQPDASVVNGYLSRLQDSIHRYSPCAQVFLYEISNGLNGPDPKDITDYRNIQDAFLRNIRKLADLGKVPFVPAGEVIRNLLLNENMFVWEGYGNIHPNAYGSYAITCAMYNAIFKKPVSGMPISPLRWARDLDPAECALIQRISDSVVLQTPPATWRHGAYQPYALFSPGPVSGNTIRFSSYSLNYDRLNWIFPDGTTSAEENPEKTLFTTGDRETVTLQAYKGDCFNSYSRTIDKNADAAHIAGNSETLLLSIYPNPAKDRLFISGSGKRGAGPDIALYSMAGQKIRTRQQDYAGGSFHMEMELADLPRGMYLLRINDGGMLSHHKIVLE